MRVNQATSSSSVDNHIAIRHNPEEDDGDQSCSPVLLKHPRTARPRMICDAGGSQDDASCTAGPGGHDASVNGDGESTIEALKHYN